MNNVDLLQFRDAAKEKDDTALLKIMSNYGMCYDFYIYLKFYYFGD